MNTKTNYLIDSILEKLKSNKKRNINLEKKEFKEFIKFIIKNS